jgi:nitrogen fixation-related uncharacterized protein
MKKTIVRILIVLVTIILLALGISNNGYKDLKNKAIRICYECIGIG